MKNTILKISILLLLTGCSKSFIQVYDTNTTNTQLRENFFVYETDTLKITYSFWASKGVMSFSVYNKMDKPIYLDWKNSSFIYNDNKLNYWIDETQANSSSYYSGYLYKGPLIKPGFVVNEGVQNSSSVSIKPERITFIPPKSKIDRFQFYLYPFSDANLDNNCETSIVPRNDKPAKNTTVYTKKFLLSNSPLRFRNYLAFSLTENSQQFFFIDNEFYLASVKEMDFGHYRGKQIGLEDNGDKKYEKPFKKPTSFYIKIAGERSISYRYRNNW